MAEWMLVVGILACASGGCQREETVVRYKPFLSNVEGAKFGGHGPVNANAGYADPTAYSGEIVKENEDGTKTLVCQSPRHVMTHLERFLDEGEDDLLMEQVISEQTRLHYQTEGKDPKEVLRYLRDNRKEVAKTFARMPFGEHTPTVILDQPGNRTWILRLTGMAAKDLKFTRVWVVMEKGNWRFLWID